MKQDEDTSSLCDQCLINGKQNDITVASSSQDLTFNYVISRFFYFNTIVIRDHLGIIENSHGTFVLQFIAILIPVLRVDPNTSIMHAFFHLYFVMILNKHGPIDLTFPALF